MKSIILLSLLAVVPLARAEEPLKDPNSDTPARTYNIVPIYEHEVSPITGRGMDEATYINIAQRLAKAEYERDELKAMLSTADAPEGAYSVKGIALAVFLALGVGVTLGLLIHK